MSKKLFSTSVWNDRLRRQKAKRRKRTSSSRRYSSKTSTTIRRTSKKKAITVSGLFSIAAPSNFSLITNPEEVLLFFLRMRSYGKKHHLWLDFSGVQHITADAVAALIATIHDVDLARCQMEGSLPSDPNAKEILIESGFFEHVLTRVPVPKCHRGRIAQRKSEKVEPLTAQALIRLGTREALGRERVCQAAYGTLIDCMNNTFNHAARTVEAVSKRYRETWWATVYADAQRKRVCFTFLDTGVGIFRSLKLRDIRRVYRAVGIYDDVDIIKDMLLGKVPSTTGLSYRGKGLPSIYRAHQRGTLKALAIIANGVYANVGTGSYKMLRSSFSGTLLYWEIE